MPCRAGLCRARLCRAEPCTPAHAASDTLRCTSPSCHTWRAALHTVIHFLQDGNAASRFIGLGFSSRRNYVYVINSCVAPAIKKNLKQTKAPKIPFRSQNCSYEGQLVVQWICLSLSTYRQLSKWLTELQRKRTAALGLCQPHCTEEMTPLALLPDKRINLGLELCTDFSCLIRATTLSTGIKREGKIKPRPKQGEYHFEKGNFLAVEIETEDRRNSPAYHNKGWTDLGMAARTSTGCSTQKDTPGLLCFTLHQGKLNLFYAFKIQKIQNINLHINKLHRIASIPAGFGPSTARQTTPRRCLGQGARPAWRQRRPPQPAAYRPHHAPRPRARPAARLPRTACWDG